MIKNPSTVRLLILSDLHLEFRRSQKPVFDLSIAKPDIVLLAGDIDTDAVGVVTWAADAFPGLPVLYVHGNHEGYGGKIDTVIEKISVACATTPNVHYLHQAEFRHMGVRFLGAALWTDFALFGEDLRQECMNAAAMFMTDYRSIRLASERYRKLRPLDTVRFHREDRTWLAKKLEQPFEGPTVVITHMAPSKASVAPQYAGDLLSAAFASNLDDLVCKANVWVHGHMHTSSDYHIGRCRVVCNPYGYINKDGGPENGEFRPDFIVELVV
jgi:predicted phosphodiesterase